MTKEGVDKKDEADPEKKKEKKDKLLEIAIVCVYSPKQDAYLVHQRSEKKDVLPGKWGIGSGGKVEDGEPIKKAAKRELYEEFGIESSVEFLFSLDCEVEGRVQRDLIFYTEYDDKFWTSDEFEKAGWMKVESINKLIERDLLMSDTKEWWHMFVTQHG